MKSKQAKPEDESSSAEAGNFLAFAKYGGVGGIALGVLLYVFRGVLQQNLLFKAGLSSNQAFYIVAALLIFTFGIATIGVVAWLINGRNPDQPMPPSSLGLLALLFLVVMGSGVYVLTLAAPEAPQLTAKTYRVCTGNGGDGPCRGPIDASYGCDQYNAIGGGGPRTYTTLGERFCTATVGGVKKQLRYDIKVYENRGGGQCGWTGFEVTCNSS